MTAGTIANSLLGLAFYVLLARLLGVSEFGRFSYYLGLGLLVAELADFGIGAAIVKFEGKATFSPTFGLAVVHRAVVFLLIFGLFFLLVKLVDQNLIYSATVAFALHLANLPVQGLIARQKFAQQVGANIVGNLLRLAAAWILGSVALLTTISGLVVFCLGAGMTSLIGFIFLQSEFSRQLFSLAAIKKMFPEIWRFSLPTAASFSLSSLSSRLDIPILYALTSPAIVGIYSAAQKLTSVLPQIAAAIDSVFAPKFSQKIAATFREYLSLVIIVSLSLVFAALVAPWLAPIIFGGQYVAASGVLTVLLLSFIPLFLAGPFAGKILYAFGKPKYYLVTAAVSFPVSLAGYFLLIPVFGATGAAATIGLTNTAALIFYVLFANRLSSH